MSLLMHPAGGDVREHRGRKGGEDNGEKNAQVKFFKNSQNEIKMTPPLSEGVNIKHSREIYMAVRRVEQNAKHQTPPVTYNNTSILSPSIISERLQIKPTTAIRPS